jgi:hypothetical protein
VKKGKRSAEARAEGRLLDFWQHKPEYGEPIGCVATTYTFDAALFEEHCLARFLGMESDPNEDARTYLLEREEKLAPTFAAVLVDHTHVPRERSLRWHLLPVRVDRGHQHAKVSLLVWRERIRLVIASANVTESGYRRNHEVAAALDFTPAGDTPLTLLADALGFLEEMRTLSPGADAVDGPHAALRRFFETVRTLIKTWTSPAWKAGHPRAVLAFVRPGRPNLFAQLRELKGDSPHHYAVVTSPFFDDGDNAVTTAQALEDLLVKAPGQPWVHFVVDAIVRPDRKVELALPSCLKNSKHQRITYRFHRVLPDENEVRPLHAKTIQIRREGGGALHCIGSSNFTRAGTGLHGFTNFEANLVYVIPDWNSDFARVCDLARPADEEVPAARAVFAATPDHSGDDLDGTPLPQCFGAATIHLEQTGNLTADLEIACSGPS